MRNIIRLAIGLLLIISLVCSIELPVLSATEDFTDGWNETDGNSDITVTSNKVDVSTMIANVESYVYKDYGSDHFGDFEHLLTFYLAWVGGGDSWGGIWSLTNSAGATDADLLTANTGLGVFYKGSPGDPTIYVWDYSDDSNSSYTLSYGTTYYLTISRSDTTLSLKLYSDASRETLLTTKTTTCPITAFRYLQTVYSKEAAGSDAYTYYVEDLDLQEASDPTITNLSSDNTSGGYTDVTFDITTSTNGTSYLFWNKTTDPGTDNLSGFSNNITLSANTGSDNVTANITDMDYSSLYYIQAAIEVDGTFYEADSSINITTTAVSTPVIWEDDPQDTYGDTWILAQGDLVEPGGEACSIIRYEWKLNADEYYNHYYEDSGSHTSGPVSYNITGLSEGETYDIRIGAYNSSGWGWSSSGTYQESAWSAASITGNNDPANILGVNREDIANILGVD